MNILACAWVVLLTAVGILLPDVARACNAPSAYSAEDNTVTFDTGVANVCSLVGDVLTCDVSAAGHDPTVTIVDDYPGDTGTHIEAWGFVGTTTQGDQYWCFDSVNYHDVTKVVIKGSQDNDVLGFRDAATATYRLGASYRGEAEIYGNASNDTIRGSDAHDVNYMETLYGELGNDTISGSAGDDTLNGGDGDDTLLGGPGDDTIYGGNGDDEIHGGDDDDTLYGDAGNDGINGEDGDDYINGGTQGDILCGGANGGLLSGDEIHDGGGSPTVHDYLWGASTTDDVECDVTGVGTFSYVDTNSHQLTSAGICTVTTTAPACP